MQALWQFDQTLFRDIHIGLHHPWLDPIFWVLSTTGLGHIQLVLSFLFMPWRKMWVYKAPANPLAFRARLKAIWGDRVPLTIPIIIAFCVSGVINTIVKQSIPRERPSNFVWAHPQEQIYANSFSSGHTATSLCIAVTILFVTHKSEKKWMGYLALAWAALVGFSRIYRGVHWPTDVIAGAGVGLVCAAALRLLLVEAFFWKTGKTEEEQEPVVAP